MVLNVVVTLDSYEASWQLAVLAHIHIWIDY